MRKRSRKEARQPTNTKEVINPVIFATKFNPHGPNVREIVNRFLPILRESPVTNAIFQDRTVMVANKKERNLCDLLVRSDPYNIKADITDPRECGYSKCKRRNCDSCNNFVMEATSITSYATGRKFRIRRDSTCSSRNVVYVAVCQSCGKQGVGSTVNWKPRLANYKSHVKKGIKTCRIVSHFIEECVDESLSNLKFIIVDGLNNTELLSKSDVDSLLLKKEQFWIGTLITQHKGLNGTHDWCRKTRTEREKDLN